MMIKLWPFRKRDIKNVDLFLENKKMQQDEYEQQKVNLDSYPTILNLPIADKCNLKCIMCSIATSPEDYKIRISDDGYRKITALYPYLERLTLEGAEVFTLQEGKGDLIDEIIDDCMEYPHLKLSALTNGQLLNDRRIDYVIKKFGVLNISIDSPDPDIYSSIRVGGKLERLIDNVRKIQTLKRKLGRTKNDPPQINFSAVVMERTYRDLPNLLKLCGELDINYFSFQPLRKAIKDHHWEEIKHENIFEDRSKVLDYLKVLQALKEVSSKVGIGYGDRTQSYIRELHPDLFPAPEKAPTLPEAKATTWPVCHYAWESLLVQPSGNVTFACCSKRILGNINTDSVRDIFNGPAAIDERRNFINGNYENCGTNCQCYYSFAGQKL